METLFHLEPRRGIIRERIRKYHIDADFVPDMVIWLQPAAVKTLQQWEKNSKAAPRRKMILNSIPTVLRRAAGYWFRRLLRCSQAYGGMSLAEFIAGLARAANSLGVKIFEYSPVVEVSYGRCEFTYCDGQQ